MAKEFDDVERRFNEIGKKCSKELEEAKIKPIDVDKFPFAQNGIWAMIAGMGKGKTYNYLKLIAKQEVLRKEPFYETVVLCSTSGDFDRTVKSYIGAIRKTSVEPIKDDNLLTWIDEYLEKFKLYNTIMRYIDSDMKRIDEDMAKLITENRLGKFWHGEMHVDSDKVLKFCANTLAEIGWKTHPHRVLLILDDFASHPLLQRKEDKLSRVLKKLRHYMITCVICVQTVKSIPKDIKRNVSDFILFPGISQYDFKDLIRESSASCFDYNSAWEAYSKLKNDHDMYCIHVMAGKIIVTPAA